MEHYINIIFNKNITLGKIEETVNSVISVGGVPLNEDGLEYEMYKENKKLGISIPLSSHVRKEKIEEYVNRLANKLFDKGFSDFDIELSLNEDDAADGPTEFTGANALQQFGQSDQRGLFNNPEQRTAIIQLQQRLIDLGYDLGPMGADGIYGRRTAAAVRAYQEANNLTVDGDAGPETIGRLLSNQPSAQPSDSEEPQTDVDTTMSDDEAMEEFITRVRAQDWAGALAIAEQYPSVRDRVSPENYDRLRQAAGAGAGDIQQPPAGDAEEPAAGADAEQPVAGADADDEDGYRVRGDIVVGRDILDIEDRRITKQWELNLETRELIILRSPNTYINVHVVVRSGNERVRVYVEERNSFAILADGYVNLLAAIKEHLENYTTPLPMDNGRIVRPSDEPTDTAPSVQTDVDQPETPSTPTSSGIEVNITGDDSVDIAAIQDALGDPPALPPAPEPGEISDNTGIRNPVTYGTALVSGIPSIVYQSIQELGGDLSRRNAEAVRDTLNYDLLTTDMARSIIRELERLYPIVQIAQAMRENDVSPEEREAILIMLQVRQDLTDHIDNPPAQTAAANDEVDAAIDRRMDGDAAATAQTDEPEDGEATGRSGDAGLSVAREARDISREIYTNLGNAITGANTDEEAIQAALQRIENEDMWNTVTGTYANRYPKPRRDNLRTGDLLNDLRGALSRRDWRNYVQPELERLGIEEEYDAPATNESIDTMKINDIVDEETYDGDDFFEEYGVLWYNEDEELDEAEYRGRKVKLGKPMKGDVKKFKVYVKNPKGNVVKVNFGDPNMRIKKSNPARRRSFRARHNCDNPGPRHKARYWSCRKW